MFHRKRLKTELQPLQAQLEAWQTEVPQRARRFHLTASEINSKIQQQFSLGKFFLNEDELKIIKNDFLALEKIAEGLVHLIKQVTELETEITQMLALVKESTDKFLARWTTEQTDNWLLRCKRLGAECERESDLADDKSKLKELQKSVRQTREAIELLKQAETLIRTCRGDFPTDVAPLEAALPNLQTQLEENGVSTSWLDELTALLEPLQQIENAVPPVSIDILSKAIPSLDSWSRLLGNYQKVEIDKLKRRYQQLKTEWRKTGQVEVDALKNEVTTLTETVTQYAQQLRVKKIKIFGERLSQFKKATGPQNDFDSQFQELTRQHANIEQQQAHKTWWEKFEVLTDQFNGIIQNYLYQLQASLQERFENIAEKVRQLKEKPLSDELAKELETGEQTLDRYQNPDDLSAEAILVGFDELETLDNQIKMLTAQVEKETESLQDAQIDFENRNANYQRIAQQYEITLENLEVKIKNLTKPDDIQSNKSLTAALNLQKELAKQLQQQEDFLKTQLKEQFSAKTKTLSDLQDSLDDATDHYHQLIELPAEPHHTDDLVVWEEDFLRLIEVERQLNKRLEETINFLEKDKDELFRRLETLKTSNTLKDDDHKELEEILDYLADPYLGTDAVDHLEHLANQVDRAKPFLNQVEKHKIALQELRENLQTQFRSFKREQLDQNIRAAWHGRRLAFDMIERIDALIQGVPEEPTDLMQAHQQLTAAKVLLSRLEIQAKRLEANKLHEAVSQLNSTQNTKIKAQWENLKTKLNTDELPSLRNRQRVYKLLEDLKP